VKEKKALVEASKKIDDLMNTLLEITKNRSVMGGKRTNVETLITIHVH
jgi:hypothetical protein